MFKKISIYLSVFTIIANSNVFAFHSFLGIDVTVEEHPQFRGHALKAMDQLDLLINYHQSLLLERFQEALIHIRPKGEVGELINQIARTIGKLVTTGIFDDSHGIVINYGISSTPATKDQAKRMTLGLKYFARLNGNSQQLFESFDVTGSGVMAQSHKQSVSNILELIGQTSLPKDIEKAMWLPITQWETTSTDGKPLEKNSRNSLGGKYRKAIMKQTRQAITYGYVSDDDGTIVLPAVSTPLQIALHHLPNVIIVENLGQDTKSQFYPSGINKLPTARLSYKTHYQVIEGDSVEIADVLNQQIKGIRRIAILNMANTKTPGGGARTHGSRAQEEQLSYRSDLLPILEAHEKRSAYDFSAGKWGISRRITRDRDCDSGIFSPDVTFFRDGVNSRLLLHYAFLSKPKSYGVITSAAVDLRKQVSLPENFKYVTKAKIRFQLRSALTNGFTDIIFSAFGCGAFKGHFTDLQEIVANCYKQVLNEEEFKDKFENIIFAIMVNGLSDQANLNAFQKIFP